MSEEQKINLLNVGYTIQAQITTLEKGLPIAEAKQRTQLDKITTRRKYTQQIADLKSQLKAINNVLFYDSNMIE